MPTWRNTSLIFVLFALFAQGSLAEPRQYYRYLNESNVVVIDDKIPPQYSGKGYDIIDSFGQLLNRIPPALVGQDKAEQDRALLQQQYDQDLLRRYSSEADIRSAEKRFNNEVALSLNALEVALEAYQKSKLETEQQLSTENDPERIETLNHRLIRLKSEITATENTIDSRKMQREQSAAIFLKELNRLKELKAAQHR